MVIFDFTLLFSIMNLGLIILIGYGIVMLVRKVFENYKRIKEIHVNTEKILSLL